MRHVFGPRRSGKTTIAIQECLETGADLIVMDRRMANQINQEYFRNSRTQSRAYSVEELGREIGNRRNERMEYYGIHGLGGRPEHEIGYRRSNSYVIDEDITLERLLEGILGGRVNSIYSTPRENISMLPSTIDQEQMDSLRGSMPPGVYDREVLGDFFGEENTSSLQRRIEELEDQLAEYELGMVG